MNSNYPQKNSSGRSSLTDDVAQDEMLTKRELAAKLKVTIRTIENWQRDGFFALYQNFQRCAFPLAGGLGTFEGQF